MNVEPYNFVSALNCILAQRLVRLICNSCKHPIKATKEQLLHSGLDPKRWGDYTFYEGKGCIDCNGTGYRGRTAIAELLDMSDRIREMILQRRAGADIKRAAKEEGMTFLREAALAKVFAGWTTIHEINKVTFVD
jgi:type IV pilus assembly protein PilB